MISDYRIIVAGSTDELQHRVRELIKEGWDTQGGLSIAYHDQQNYVETVVLYGQAMVKYQFDVVSLKPKRKKKP